MSDVAPPSILAERHGAVGWLRLNRAKTLHALSLDMVESLTQNLQAWAQDSNIGCILLDHAEGRGFCAGGDIRFLQNSALHDGGATGRAFFYAEYQLNHLMFTTTKPIVAFMDGITMGGGVGISQPARYRVATENTRYAMPETGIGLFPDVGGGWYLSRLPGRMGEYLALTGARIDGADCMALGLATHYVESAQLPALKAALIAAPQDIDGLLAQFAKPAPPSRLMEHAQEVATLFASDKLEDILAALAASDSPWAAAQAKDLAGKSPQTCKVALRQLLESKKLGSFAENMAMEYRIASRVLTRPDFIEGVRAVIVDKDNAPRWNPPTAEAVSDALIDEIFAPLPADQEWKPL